LEEADKWGKVYLEEKTDSYPTLRGDYRFFYNNIAKAILHGESLLVRLEEAIMVLKLIESAFLSSEQKKTITKSEGGW
jgi:scyllo-inositol 2-dehydrogenase (NADP+)